MMKKKTKARIWRLLRGIAVILLTGTWVFSLHLLTVTYGQARFVQGFNLGAQLCQKQKTAKPEQASLEGMTLEDTFAGH